MIREIVHDPLLLALKSEPAVETDRPVITDLADTLTANRDRCVGMAANMIGERKRIIVFFNGPILMAMVNPKIIRKSGEYLAEEGYLDESFRPRTNVFRGFTAQIIQHECDHCDGILI